MVHHAHYASTHPPCRYIGNHVVCTNALHALHHDQLVNTTLTMMQNGATLLTSARAVVLHDVLDTRRERSYHMYA